MFSLLAIRKHQQAQMGGPGQGQGEPRRKGGVKDFLALVGKAPMRGQIQQEPHPAAPEVTQPVAS